MVNEDTTETAGWPSGFWLRRLGWRCIALDRDSRSNRWQSPEGKTVTETEAFSWLDSWLKPGPDGEPKLIDGHDPLVCGLEDSSPGAPVFIREPVCPGCLMNMVAKG